MIDQAKDVATPEETFGTTLPFFLYQDRQTSFFHLYQDRQTSFFLLYYVYLTMYMFLTNVFLVS